MAEAATDTEEDIRAARRFAGFQNDWYLSPLFRGCYLDDMLELYGEQSPQIFDGDLDQICVPIDYLGINFYRAQLSRQETKCRQ